MMRRAFALFVGLLLSPTTVGAAELQAAAYARYEAGLDSTLEARNPAALSLFLQANAARDSGASTRAIELYTRVLALVPDFTAAIRRRATERVLAGDSRTAVSELRALVLRDASGYNHSALAYALLNPAAGGPPNFADAGEARTHALLAVGLDADDLMGWDSCWRVALAQSDTTLMRRSMQALQRLAPGSLPAWYAVLIYVLGVEHDPRAAETALDSAVGRGLPAQAVTPAYQAIRELHNRERHRQWLIIAGACLVGWLLAFFVLWAVGALLSRLTMRAATATLAGASGRAVGLSGWLRRVYRSVLWLSCAYYWASLPLILVLVIALGGGIVYASLTFGYVPVKLVVIVVILTFVTVVSIVRSLLIWGRDHDPGIRVELAEYPRLRETLSGMAERVGTRVVDTIFVTPGTELAVFERGGLRSQLRGQAERCLILGIGVLDGMTVGQFNAVLAHEYGHFSNRDTAGGGFALSVRRSLITMAVHLARGGAAGWYNPAWQFLKGFDAVFMRISQGASRLQEVLADRWAAVTCGSEAFVSGLRHVIEASVRFNARANAVVNEALKQRVPLPNLYRFTTTTPEAAAAESEIPAELAKALDAEPSEYDSHPTPRQRISWVTSLAIVVEPHAGDADGAWSMFPDREHLERLLTEHVRGNLERTHGVEFATEGV